MSHAARKVKVKLSPALVSYIAIFKGPLCLSDTLLHHHAVLILFPELCR